jgi:hypothetical protein
MFVRGVDSRLLFCNQRFLDFHQVSADEALGTPLADSPWLAPEFRESLPPKFQAVVEKGVPVSVTLRAELRGKFHVMHAWMVPCRDSSGQPTGVLGGLQDITDSEGELLEWRDRALAAEARLHRIREIGTAAMEELTAQVAGLELHPATPGLAGVLETLRRLRSTSNPREDHPAPASAPCDLGALVMRCLASYPACHFEYPHGEALRGWLDAELFGQWLAAALELIGEPTRVSLATRAARQGQLLVRLEASGSQGPHSLILQQYVLRLAQRLNARIGIERSDESLVIDLELELALAAT